MEMQQACFYSKASFCIYAYPSHAFPPQQVCPYHGRECLAMHQLGAICPADHALIYALAAEQMLPPFQGP